MQKAAGTVSAKAAELGKTAKDKATEKMPGFAQTAMSKAGTIPGLRGRVNGSPDYANDGADVYNPPPATGATSPDDLMLHGEHPVAVAGGHRAPGWVTAGIGTARLGRSRPAVSRGSP